MTRLTGGCAAHPNSGANLRRAILPALGTRRLDTITRADIVRFHLDRKDTPATANRCVALLSHMFTMSEEWGLRPDGSNPCRHVKRFPEKKRKRFLSGEEMARLGQALAHVEAPGDGRRESPLAVAALRLLILTGARLSEILTLKWEYVDFERGILQLPDSKTGERPIYLNAPALQVLSELPRIMGNPYVIPGKAARCARRSAAASWSARPSRCARAWRAGRTTTSMRSRLPSL